MKTSNRYSYRVKSGHISVKIQINATEEVKLKKVNYGFNREVER